MLLFAFILIISLLIFLILKSVFKKQFKLKGKTVLITGPSGGLGKALAFAFHNQCCHLHLCSRNIEELNKLKKILNKSNNDLKVEIHQLDLSDSNSIDAVIDSIISNNQIDILVNNAALRFRGEIIETPVKIYKKIFEVNFFGQVAVTNKLLSHFIKRKTGYIVGISSIQGKLATPFRAPYSTSKHACQAFYDTVRAEVPSKDIHVSVINPSYINTMSSNKAITSKGEIFGKVDKNDKEGMNVDEVASKIINSVMNYEQEVDIIPIHHKLVLGIRLFLPDLYFWIMKKRAGKSKQKSS